MDEISAKIYRKDLERLANKLGLVKDDIDEIRDIYDGRQEQVIKYSVWRLYNINKPLFPEISFSDKLNTFFCIHIIMKWSDHAIF